MKFETIFYKGAVIRNDGLGHYTAMFDDEDGDLIEITTTDLGKAKRVIDSHLDDENGGVQPNPEPKPEPKAKLVTFSITTRVIINETGDREQDEERAYGEAREKIMQSPRDYLGWDNLDYVEDDKEMPYDPKYDRQ